MLNKEQANAIEPAKKVALIIFSALVLGVLFFAAITCVVRLSSEESLFNMELSVIALVGVAFAAIVLIPSIIVPMFAQKAAVKEVAKEFAGKLDESAAATKMFGGFQTAMIIGLALLEGAAFFNLIAFLIDGSVFSMVAVAVLLSCMLVRIPLPLRIEDKIANMLDDAKHK